VPIESIIDILFRTTLIPLFRTFDNVYTRGETWLVYKIEVISLFNRLHLLFAANESLFVSPFRVMEKTNEMYIY
jgi:hypothetical protein